MRRDRLEREMVAARNARREPFLPSRRLHVEGPTAGKIHIMDGRSASIFQRWTRIAVGINNTNCQSPKPLSSHS
jgi:hypothetical protein